MCSLEALCMWLDQVVDVISKGTQAELHPLGSSQCPETPVRAPPFCPFHSVPICQALHMTNHNDKSWLLHFFYVITMMLLLLICWTGWTADSTQTLQPGPHRSALRLFPGMPNTAYVKAPWLLFVQRRVLVRCHQSPVLSMPDRAPMRQMLEDFCTCCKCLKSYAPDNFKQRNKS